ncbi:protein-methionine-sulfoxide reductase heme-binding subunit MsrQ [uncultured Thiodictyon sp.]|uniref:protein-methionine-sulfoxide reductase heme-binding subunit MsrQ n=1 Tax=uncultured Thiodictyon sp. TaxID=1846217 RepID=UPI0025E0C429|nr:protein-methionine-sulfoxide reductase heme-binding subunit MsrQ [uncultured Thiodictyon sp.]
MAAATPRLKPDTAVRYGKPLVFALCLLPLALMVWLAAVDRLGANPVEAVLHFTGDFALRLLLFTLAVTPLRRLTGLAWLVRFRRMLGLFAFFYALLHFTVYLALDRSLDWGEVVTDLAKRPYIMVGFAAFVLLVPLAVTSTRGWVRRLGRRWQQLHRFVYLIAVLGVLHFFWLVKADVREPLIYAAVLAVLLAARLPWFKPASAGSGRAKGKVSVT